MSDILLHGKYSGFTFEEILKKDLPYCNFMKSLKFVKPHFQAFIDFLDINLEKANYEVKLEKSRKCLQ